MATLVPTNRLLFWAGCIGLPCALFSTAVPEVGLVFGIGLVALVLLALIDAFRAPPQLAGIEVAPPEGVRLSVDRPADLELTIRRGDAGPDRLRIGLPFPEEIQTDAVDRWTALNEAGLSTCRWTLQGLKKGRFVMDTVYLETESPLGFWGARTRRPISIDIQVYPGLGPERRNLAGLFLNPESGIHTRRQVGKGRDFEQLRDYLPGDSYEDIHWKATAKRRHPVTKIYQVERTQQIYAVIDASRLSCRKMEAPADLNTPAGAPDSRVSATVLDRYITAALILGLAAERQGDQFGIITFDDQVRTFLRARSGKTHYGLCRDRLYTLDPRPVSPDFHELFTVIATRLRRRALLVFLTHLDDPVLADSFISRIDLIRRRHLVLVNLLQPPAARPLFAGDRVETTDDLYRRLGGQMLLNGLQETGKRLNRRGVQYLLTDDERMCARLVSRYVAVKGRQML
ncbi:MAG: DUF58 domain-containing protein [Thermodesulfobacteriota bacterium]